jgi:hypothetical protein
MHEAVLERIQKLVGSGDVYFTSHAEEEMVEDNLTVYDVESVILSGQITRRQRDLLDYKYVIDGETTAADEATVVCKLRNEVVIITVFMGTL